MISVKVPSHKQILYVIFTLAILLRFGLALLNNGSSNDNHYEVSALILETGEIPGPKDCWQCYHPKLYHFSVASLWHFFNITSVESRIVFAQLLNALAGILTLFIFWSFIQKQAFKPTIKLLVFTLIALNPRLIAISSQISNDSYIILFGTIIIYSLYQLIHNSHVKYFWILLTFSILAGLTKTNSFVLILGVLIVFILKIVSNSNYRFSFRTGYLGMLLVFLITTSLSIGILGGYYNNYKKFNTAYVYNTHLGEAPHFIEKTNFRRPGVQSIVSGYFTFRIIDMLIHPVITNHEKEYPIHRTSVFSQLYGRSNFLYFDNWPPGPWQTINLEVQIVGRFALLLGLIPFLILMIGFFKEFKIWVLAFRERNIDFLKFDTNWIFHVFIVGFLSFIILFTFKGRDFSFMKVIYIFPGILAIIIPLLKGAEWVYGKLRKNKTWLNTFHVLIVLLVVAYLIPVFNLMLKLSRI